MLAIAPVPCRPAPLQTDRVRHQQPYFKVRPRLNSSAAHCPLLDAGASVWGVVCRGQTSPPEQALQRGIDAVSRQRERKDGQQAGRQVHDSGRICSRGRQGGRQFRGNACLLRDVDTSGPPAQVILLAQLWLLLLRCQLGRTRL